jgi:hypothetical protein
MSKPTVSDEQRKRKWKAENDEQIGKQNTHQNANQQEQNPAKTSAHMTGTPALNEGGVT